MSIHKISTSIVKISKYISNLKYNYPNCGPFFKTLSMFMQEIQYAKRNKIKLHISYPFNSLRLLLLTRSVLFNFNTDMSGVHKHKYT